MEIPEKCRAVADAFDWYANAANKYQQEDNWTEGRIQFVEERYAILERIQKGMAGGGYKLFIPLPVKTSKSSFSWRVVMSTLVTGYKCTEYLHLLKLQDPQQQECLLLYRTKDKSRELEQGTVVSGKVGVRDDKVKFGGFDIPVASKVDLA